RLEWPHLNERSMASDSTKYKSTPFPTPTRLVAVDSVYFAANHQVLVLLERFFGLPYIARPGFEASEFLEERERNFADRSVALLRDDQFGLAGFFHARLFIFLIKFRPDEQGDQIGILFNRTRFPQVAQARLPTRPLLRLPVQLCNHN